MAEGLKDLKTHLMDSLPRQLAIDTMAAFMDACRKGSGTDWSEEGPTGSGLEINEKGEMTFNGNEINTDNIGEGDNPAPKGDYKIGTTGKMSREEAMQESGRIFENRGLTNIEVTEEMLKDVLGEDNGALVWNHIVATSILSRIAIPNIKDGKKGEYSTKERPSVGRGIQMQQRKHQVARSIMTAGDYYPGTALGYSRSKPEKYRSLDKDKGGANFSIVLDVSGSNGNRANPKSRLNAVLCLASALVVEASELGYGVSLYVNPSGVALPKDSPLNEPQFYDVEISTDWQDPSAPTRIERSEPDIDPRYYFQNSTDYSKLLRVLSEEVDCTGGETPYQVFGRLTHDLKQLPKKKKATVIWIADCTIPEFYLGVKNFYDEIQQRGEFWIIQVGNEGSNIRRDMESKFGTTQNPKIPGVKYAAMPDFSKPGMNPDTLPLAMAEALGLTKVKISATNGLNDFF